jgi:hypothetical protein
MILRILVLVTLVATIFFTLHLANKLGESFASRVETRMQMHNL